MPDEETQFHRMRAGKHYHMPDQEIFERQLKATQLNLRVNATEGGYGPDDRRALLQEALGAFGESFLIPPVRWEYGKHIFIGTGCLINSNCLLMDGADIRIGDFTLIAPNCSLLTAGHPVLPEERQVIDQDTGKLDHAVVQNKPITIGSHCWIGAASVILGGVTIGDGTTVGAGSVVTKSLPPRVLAAGNPARIIRELPPPKT